MLLLVIQITGGEAVTTGAWGDAIAGDWAIKNGGESGGIGRGLGVEVVCILD